MKTIGSIVLAPTLLVAVCSVASAQAVVAPPLFPAEQTEPSTSQDALSSEVDAAEAAKPVEPPAADSAESQQPYWIGILGGEVSPALKSHLGLEGAGVLVREVVPKSPAAEAGLQQHDVILTANGHPATDMSVLAQEVRSVGGTQQGKIVLDLLRTGAHQQLTIVPAPRPENPPTRAAAPAMPALPQAPNNGFGLGGFAGEADGPFRFRLFGPGQAQAGGANVNIQAGNTSVKVESRNGKSHVSVTQGDQHWEFDGQDQQALEQLPPDVRAMVEGLLTTPQPGVDVDVEVPGAMPAIPDWFEGFGQRRAERLENRLRKQMERMERQLEAMRRQFEGDAGDPVAPPASNVAPEFDPAAPAAEIELPAVEEQPQE